MCIRCIVFGAAVGTGDPCGVVVWTLISPSSPALLPLGEGSRSGLRPVDKPVFWIGHDRVLCNDKTVYGLRRKVIARKDEPPNCVTWIAVAIEEAKPVMPKWWLARRESDGFWLLWITWKEG